MATLQTTTELRRAAADYIERAGYVRKPEGSPSAVSRARVRDEDGKWLPRVDAYGALCYVGGVIATGPCGWVYDDKSNPGWELVHKAWEELGIQYKEFHFALWEYADGRTPEEVLAALRNV